MFLGKVLTDEQLEGLRIEEARFRVARSVDESKLGTHFFGNLPAYSPILREVITRGAHRNLAAVAGHAERDISPRPVCHQDARPRQSRGEFPWHQDEGYEPVEPAMGVTVWIALDDMTLENGCTWVVPESHKQGHEP